MSKITVVIPAYNAAETIKPCLESIYNQTFDNVKIVVVNDGSTDDTANILAKHQERITIVTQDNKGASVARNAGAKIAASPYIIFCDADITLVPHALETMHDALEKHPTASYAYSSFYFGKELFKLWPFDAQKLKQGPYIHTTSLIRTETFPGFDEKLKRFQDWDLWLTMLKRGYTGIFITEPLFTVKTGGTMSNWLPKWAYAFSFLPAVKKYNEAKKVIVEKHHL